MNLLRNDWIPIRNNSGQFSQVSLQTLLTQSAELTLSLPRDDMELACLQLLICLTQVLFAPKDKKERRQRLVTPLSGAEYQAAIVDKLDWFDLNHATQPFMQTRGVKAAEFTDMAKLFAGLDSKSSCCFMNEPNLATQLCASCAAIGLFNQANNAPSFGGGFKSSLRGGAPITTLVLSPQLNDLRQTVWYNVLHEDTLLNLMPWFTETQNQAPVWVEPIKASTKIYAHQTGLLRGLFWQPAHIELIQGQRGQCSCCGVTDDLYSGFNKEKFVYDFLGTFPHPHAPRRFTLTKGEREEKFASFTTTAPAWTQHYHARRQIPNRPTTAPAWTQLCQFLMTEESDKGGYTPAAVISQAAKAQPLFLLVGGYRNNQAAILERHHDLFNIAQGWQENYDLLREIIELGLAYKTELRKKLFGFYKATQIDLCAEAESRFYSQSETLIHDSLKQLTFKEKKAHFAVLNSELSGICRRIFHQLTEPYQDNPTIIKALTISRRSLENAFTSLKDPDGEKK